MMHSDKANKFEYSILAADETPSRTQARTSLIPTLRRWPRHIRFSTEELAIDLLGQSQARNDISQHTFANVLTKYDNFFKNFQATGN